VADAGRVIAGLARGVRLVAPGPGTRPLGDRAKQAVFAAIEPQLAGAAVLDLFAGSGAAGIEALSRGASRAVFVDDDRGACRAVAVNLERAGLAGSGSVVAADAAAYLRSLEAAGGGADVPFDLVIVDPPYADTGLRDRVIAALAAPGAPLRDGALVVVTAHWRTAPSPIGLLRSTRVRRFGETSITTFRRAPADGDPAGAAASSPTESSEPRRDRR
jgi:16S rRNA (guanine966-N2)-methyltransferase